MTKKETFVLQTSCVLKSLAKALHHPRKAKSPVPIQIWPWRLMINEISCRDHNQISIKNFPMARILITPVIILLWTSDFYIFPTLSLCNVLILLFMNIWVLNGATMYIFACVHLITWGILGGISWTKGSSS